MKSTQTPAGGTVYEYVERAGWLDPVFFRNLRSGTVMVELRSCCIDHCWHTWILVDGRVKMFKLPGGRYVPGSLRLL